MCAITPRTQIIPQVLSAPPRAGQAEGGREGGGGGSERKEGSWREKKGGSWRVVVGGEIMGVEWEGRSGAVVGGRREKEWGGG